MLAILSQLTAFYGTRLLPAGPMHQLTSRWDQMIPLSPVWVTVYFLVFPVWAASILAILSESRERAYRFTAAYMLAMFVSGLIFVFYPCTMQRPEVPGTDVFSAVTRLLYRIDPPTCIFPSLHVMISYFCWRGAMDSRNLPTWFAPLQFGVLLCVCLSILFVKQHVLVDIPTAIVIGELALQTAKRLPIPPEKTVEREIK